MNKNIFYFLLGIFFCSPAWAASLPVGFTETQYVSGLAAPTAMALSPDGRLFVAEQGGRLRVIKNGALLATPFLTVTVDPTGERGLLGVAFDPNFSLNQFIYVYYTATSPTIHNRLSRFTASGDVAVAGSEVILLDIEALSTATNHNGGAIHFGIDNKLYVAVGDNANGANAPSLSSLKGKMLRLNADGSIPADNPFYSATTGNFRAIWARGLRNPFTFSVQPGTGKILINDVGQNTWEEINLGVAGANYGWPTTEGYTTDPNFTSPIYAYDHSAGDCAITGGAFYNPTTVNFPSTYVGRYFFADYCGGWIRHINPSSVGTPAAFAAGISAPVDLQVANDGSLYYLARGAGSVYRVRYTAGEAPAITNQPQSITVAAGQPASFSVTASGSTPLNYQWLRNGADIAGATSPAYTIGATSSADNGALFRCRVTNNFGTALSNEARLTVLSNSPPTGTITSPAQGTLYKGGDIINYAGTGSDPEDGALGAGAFTWRVDFHHDTHIHPFIPDRTGAMSGSFTIPTIGETSSNVWYRIYLTVKDSAGLTHTSFRDVLPRKVTVTIATDPAGLQINLDGQPGTAPLTFTGVVGIQRNIEAPSPQSLNGTGWEFVSWSDGGAANHNIATPDANTTYTAVFRQITNAPPVVALTSPADGITVARRSVVTINASASDADGITRVEFYVNGVLTCSDSAASYSCPWTVPGGRRRPFRIQARAYDTLGAIGNSPIITVYSH
jgi:glucose/arabinose dehydrogenase